MSCRQSWRRLPREVVYQPVTTVCQFDELVTPYICAPSRTAAAHARRLHRAQDVCRRDSAHLIHDLCADGQPDRRLGAHVTSWRQRSDAVPPVALHVQVEGDQSRQRDRHERSSDGLAGHKHPDHAGPRDGQPSNRSAEQEGGGQVTFIAFYDGLRVLLAVST